ncbi:MAG: phage tail tape measure protein [Pseudomonadota bacterium]
MRSFRSVAREAKMLNGTALGGVVKPFSRMGNALQGAGIAALGFAGGAVAAGLAARAAVTDFAQLDRHLRRIAITGDATEEDAAAAGKAIRALAQMPGSPGLETIVEGLDALVASGRSLPEAMRFLPSVVVTAQAAGAATAEIATTADAIGANFGIAADKMQRAFDILVAGGKLGKFELKDMARYLPSLANAAAPVVGKGEEGLRKLVALAQAVRAGTGSAEEANASLMNIFSKMETDQTVKNFKEFGINLPKALAKARKEGRDLLEVFIDLSGQALKGDLSKIPQLFSDQEFARGMRALLAAPDALRRFQGALANVDGTALRDFGRIANDTQDKIEQFTNAWREMTLLVGGGAAPFATDLLERIRLQFRDLQTDFVAFDDWVKARTGMSVSEIASATNKALGGETNEEMRARVERKEAEQRDPALAKRNAAARAEEESRAKAQRARSELDKAKAAGTSKLAETVLTQRLAEAEAEYEKNRKARENADKALPYLQQGLDAVSVLPQPGPPRPMRDPRRGWENTWRADAATPMAPSPVAPIEIYEARAKQEAQASVPEQPGMPAGTGGTPAAQPKLGPPPPPPKPAWTPSPAQAAFAAENVSGFRQKPPSAPPPPSAGDISSPEAVGRQMSEYLAVPGLDLSQVKAAEEEAQRAGQGISEALSVTAAPQVDMSSMAAALDLARELNRELAKAGTLAAQAEAAGRSRSPGGWDARGTFTDGVY